MPILAEGFDVLTCGLVETCALLALADGLELLERRSVLFALAPEAVFLNAQIVELALIGEKDSGFDELLADGFFFVRELIGELQAADGVNAGFERRDALKSPFGIGNRLDQIIFGVVSGLIAFAEAGEVGFLQRGVFGWEQDRAAGEARFHCVL